MAEMFILVRSFSLPCCRPGDCWHPAADVRFLTEEQDVAQGPWREGLREDILDLSVRRFANVLSKDLRPSFVGLLKQEKDSVDPLVDSTDLIQQLVEDGIG
ncbi:unnamed protein product [Symbiodinium sp. CCMP2592]|nr:unnamed protein product [Symbiodinium sp. CCMP2592]